MDTYEEVPYPRDFAILPADNVLMDTTLLQFTFNSRHLILNFEDIPLLFTKIASGGAQPEFGYAARIVSGSYLQD